MERLDHAINEDVASGHWKSISLGRGGPSLSNLFFAYDLVLFGEASMEHTRVIQDVLDVFCQFLGHKVNASKSNLCFSSNMKDWLQSSIGNTLGFQLTDDLGKYLGVPLFHSRVTKSTFQFVVDKVQKKLNSYDAKLLSLAGRVTLVKSTLLAISGYFMQLAMIPIRV